MTDFWFHATSRRAGLACAVGTALFAAWAWRWWEREMAFMDRVAGVEE